MLLASSLPEALCAWVEKGMCKGIPLKESRDLCFGPFEGVFRYFWLIIGLLILGWGLSSLLEIYFHITFQIWPFVVIAIGLYIIYHVLTRR